MFLSDNWALVILLDMVLRLVQLEGLCWVTYVTWSLRKAIRADLENRRAAGPVVAPPEAPCRETEPEVPSGGE